MILTPELSHTFTLCRIGNPDRFQDFQCEHGQEANFTCPSLPDAIRTVQNFKITCSHAHSTRASEGST